MSVTTRVRDRVRARPIAVTAAISVVGYALVIGTFAGVLGIYPELSGDTVRLLADLIAVINTFALTALLAGVYFVKNGEYRKHRTAMLVAFGLILLFLAVYLLKVGGGFEREIVGAPDAVRLVYLVMLAVHIVLSIISVPLVLYAVVLGLTHSFAELKDTSKARVGRIAASVWILSLAFGIVTYLLLNHVYDAQPRESGALLLLLAAPAPGLDAIRDRLW
jgi:putative membrane protein